MIAPRCTMTPAGAAAAAARRHRQPLPRLETARLVLRAPSLDDLPLWSALCAGPDGAHLGGPLEPRAAFEAFCVYAAGWVLHGHGIWSVERRAAGAQARGSAAGAQAHGFAAGRPQRGFATGVTAPLIAARARARTAVASAPAARGLDIVVKRNASVARLGGGSRREPPRGDAVDVHAGGISARLDRARSAGHTPWRHAAHAVLGGLDRFGLSAGATGKLCDARAIPASREVDGLTCHSTAAEPMTGSKGGLDVSPSRQVRPPMPGDTARRAPVKPAGPRAPGTDRALGAVERDRAGSAQQATRADGAAQLANSPRRPRRLLADCAPSPGPASTLLGRFLTQRTSAPSATGGATTTRVADGEARTCAAADSALTRPAAAAAHRDRSAAGPAARTTARSEPVPVASDADLAAEESGDALLGFVLLGLEWDDVEPELGWAFAPAARGQGFALEAATAARDHALSLFGPGGFVSYVDATNTRSAALAARLEARRDAAAEHAIGQAAQVWRHGAPA